MRDRSGETFELRRRSFEKALEQALAALDRGHYPPSLLQSLELVLKAPHPLRGLPLLADCLAGQQGVRGIVQVALESLLRGFLLLAEMGLDRQFRPATAKARSLEKMFSPAHLLLTADTLFTWPMELAAGRAGRDGIPLTGLFSGVLGAGGVLGGLDSAQPDLEGLATVGPVEALAVAAGNKATGLRGSAAMAARWIYLREMEDWFGMIPAAAAEEAAAIEDRLDDTAGKSSSRSSGRRVAALVGYLKGR